MIIIFLLSAGMRSTRRKRGGVVCTGDGDGDDDGDDEE